MMQASQSQPQEQGNSKQSEDARSLVLATSLNVPGRNIRALIPVVDLFVVDIKSWDDETYVRYTAKSPKRMIRNLEILERLCPEKVKVRIPVIPGYTTVEECQATADIMRQRGFQVDVSSDVIADESRHGNEA